MICCTDCILRRGKKEVCGYRLRKEKDLLLMPTPKKCVVFINSAFIFCADVHLFRRLLHGNIYGILMVIFSFLVICAFFYHSFS